MKWNIVITTENEQKTALARLSKIFDALPDSAEGMEAELLVTLIENYEEKHYPISLPDPIAAINEMMDKKSLQAKDLISAVGSKTTVSLILNRKRSLTIDMVRNLSQLLNIPVEVLIQPYELKVKNESKQTQV